LLEEKIHLRYAALPLNALHPLLFHFPGAVATLPADDHPINSRQVNFTNILQQRLD
jgi:hypothetical protein